MKGASVLVSGCLPSLSPGLHQEQKGDGPVRGQSWQPCRSGAGLVRHEDSMGILCPWKGGAGRVLEGLVPQMRTDKDGGQTVLFFFFGGAIRLCFLQMRTWKSGTSRRA